nr:regulatory protein leu3 [Quercus suber]
MEPILHLGWPPLHATPAIVPAIQALLILSFFPFPTDTTSKDNSYALSGMAITLAMQIGLHAPTHDTDYYSSFQINSEDIARRVRLWHYCVKLSSNRAACGLGYPITVSPDRLEKQMDLEGLLSLVPAGLLLEMKLGMLLSRVNSLFSPSRSSRDEEHSKLTRSMIADNFEAQLDELESERTPTNLERLYLNIARLQLRVHCLRDCGNEKEGLSIVQLGLSATLVIDLTESLDAESGLAIHCPHYIYRMITLAAAVLLRFLKVQMHDDRRESTQAYRARYFKAISLMKKMSIINNDMPSRMAHIFSQLWSSDRVFRQANGLTFPIRTQSRLSMSILHDTMWEWREEFAGKRRVSQSRSASLVAYHTGTGSGALNGTSPYAVNPDEVPAGPTSNDSSGMFWDSAFDQDFESMIKEFPEAWPQ